MKQNILVNTTTNNAELSGTCTLGDKEHISHSTPQPQVISHRVSIELTKLEGNMAGFVSYLLTHIRPQFPRFIFRFTQGFFNLHIHIMPTHPLDEPQKTFSMLEKTIRESV